MQGLKTQSESARLRLLKTKPETLLRTTTVAAAGCGRHVGGSLVEVVSGCCFVTDVHALLKETSVKEDLPRGLPCWSDSEKHT